MTARSSTRRSARGTEERRPGPTVFVNIGKWERRKGHDFLLEAFCNAFTPRDDVVLKLLCHNYTFAQQANDAWARRFLHSALGSRVQLVPRLATQHAVAELIAGCDCGVFPSRAEGWNLGLLECMSVGLNVIATDYSAHTEFASEANCRLVHVEGTEPAHDGQWCKGQGGWAKLGASQMEQMVHHLREVHRLKQEGTLARNEAGIATARALDLAAHGRVRPAGGPVECPGFARKALTENQSPKRAIRRYR